MENICIRKAAEADMPAVLNLIKELAHYEKCEDQVQMTAARLRQDGFGKSPAFNCVIACREEEVLGFCLSWYRYSTWRGRILYVEDLYVREAHRRHGIGKSLMEAVMESAQMEGISHIHLQVLDWNQPAIEFYKKYNPAFDDSWINVLIPLDKAFL
jgi:ribosomal protein S18 acetylase RimI-like enzyme